MSHYNKSQYPEGTFEICPKFIDFNNKSCRDLSNRYSKHNTHRSKCITRCCNETMNELQNLNPKLLNNAIHIIFEEQIEILSSSIREMDYQINKTSTVQAHKCKTKIKTYQQFSKKANNRQDQNSWKVSGEYFFTPYIQSFIQFIKQRIIPMLNINNNDNNMEQIKREFIKLSGIIFAVKLLKCKVKFERAKEKPLIRDRTLVLSGPLHEAFKKLHPMLDVPKFYLLEKAKRKKMKKKIVSADFHANIGQFCEYLLEIQRKAVINPNYFNYENNMDEIAEKYNFPKDWLSDDNELNEVVMDNADNDADESKSESLYQPDGSQSDEPLNDMEMGMVVDENADFLNDDVPPPISWQPNAENKEKMQEDDDNNTLASDSTQNSHSFTPFNVIQTNHYHDNAAGGGNTGYSNMYNSNNNNVRAGNNGNTNTNINTNNLRVKVRAFQEMPNFGNPNTGGIHKPNISPDSTKYERKYRNDRELYIQQAQNLRNNHHQHHRPSMQSYHSADSYSNHNQQRSRRERVEPRLPPKPCNTQSVPFDTAVMNYYGNDQSSIASTAPSTPPTPTLPPKPPQPARYNPYNPMNNNNHNNNHNYHYHDIRVESIDRGQNDDNTGNESIISEPISIFPDFNNFPKPNILNVQISGPGTLCPMGSDTVMMGGLNAGEGGWSFNNN